jgi:3-polyprenyl-4-hydroxybenzoate decarboxylase
MHIAIDVNDATVAEKILQFLQNFKNEVSFVASNEDERFTQEKKMLHDQVKAYRRGDATLLNQTQYKQEMESFLLQLKDRYADR